MRYLGMSQKRERPKSSENLNRSLKQSTNSAKMPKAENERTLDQLMESYLKKTKRKPKVQKQANTPEHKNSEQGDNDSGWSDFFEENVDNLEISPSKLQQSRQSDKQKLNIINSKEPELSFSLGLQSNLQDSKAKLKLKKHKDKELLISSTNQLGIEMLTGKKKARKSQKSKILEKTDIIENNMKKDKH